MLPAPSSFSCGGEEVGEKSAKGFILHRKNVRIGTPLSTGYVQTEHLYNIQCSEIFTLRNEKLHTEA